MNFNTNNAILSRQQQQTSAHPQQQTTVHNNQLGMSNHSSFPSTTLSGGGTGQQKPSQTAMPGDEKLSIPVTTGSSQVIHPQNNNNNNNNHGSNLPPAQQLLMQQNRNVNLTTNQQMTSSAPSQQQAYYQQQQVMSSASKMGPNINFLQQMNQLVYQQQINSQGTSIPSSSNMQDLASLGSSTPQKFQTTSQGTSNMHMRQNYGVSPPHINTSAAAGQSQHNMQYSPSKPIHPQMKTTAKLASPGSQLQTLQKSPPQGTQLPPSPVPSVQLSNVSLTNPQLTQTSQAQTLPVNLNPLATPSNVTSNIIASSQPNPTVQSSPQKSQSIPSPAKSTPVTISPVSNVQASNSPSQSTPQKNATNNSTTVPSPAVTLTSPSIDPKEATPQDVVVIKEQIKSAEIKTTILPQSSIINEAGQKSTPIKSTEDKKIIESPVKPSMVLEKQVSSPQKTPQTSTPVVIKSATMRLATVATPPRKKPPPTITKKITPHSTQQKMASTKSVPAKSEVVVEKPLKASPEVPKTPQKSSAKINRAENSAGPSNVTPKTKRVRTKVQPYQSPTPELALVTKLSTQIANGSSNNNKNGEDKLTLFYKNEFLAVRNGEGGFYLCQAMHNVYRSSPKIKIRWLNEKEEGKTNDAGGRTYMLDFYDLTDLECVLTTVDLEKVESKTYALPQEEIARIESILKKAIDVEKGILPRPSVTENNPDGLDLSIYKDESQLDKLSSRKRKGKKSDDDYDEDDGSEEDDQPLSKKRKSLEIPPNKTLTPRASARKPTVVDADDSSESDEENLMELKKKATSQVEINKSEKVKQKIVVESSPSKELKPVISGRGRKRATDKSSEHPPPEKSLKVLKNEKSEELQKVSPKATSTLPAGKEIVKDKKQSAKEKSSDSTTAVKKEIVSKVQTSPIAAMSKSKVASKEKSVTPTTPIKKQEIAERAAKTTPRGRNTRSKK